MSRCYAQITLADRRRLHHLVAAKVPINEMAGHLQKPRAASLFLSTVRLLPAPLKKEKPLIEKERNRAFGTRLRYTARIGRPTQQEAEAVSLEVSKSGGACIVFIRRADGAAASVGR